MKAVQFKFSGHHSVINIQTPTPAHDGILIKVKYSALDTALDACLNKEIMGYFVHKLKEPLYLGYHYAGTVEAIGSDVTDMGIGTDVFGHLQYEPSQIQGAFAEYIAVKREDCAIKPSNVSYELAAASTTESITALQAIRDLGGLQKGHSILIVGAAGGVGSAAVQIAKALEVHVTAVSGRKDVAQVNEWGADIALDRSSDPDYVKRLVKDGVQFDVIFDAPNMLPSVVTKLLKPNGVLVNTVPVRMTFLWNKIKTLFSSKKVFFVECHSNNKDLTLIGTWLSEGQLKIPIDSAYNVKAMAEAMAKQKGKKKAG
jgi:NADPH:quinone reductase-like Zn-dependent oxidoreductase